MKPKQITDIDGNIYNTVEIGNQIWMAENLKVTRYNDGTKIGRHSWMYPKTKGIYGRLYDFHAVATDKLAPIGWHVPTDEEWTELTDYLGGLSVAGSKLKEKGCTHWMNSNKDADNISGFTALPGGYRYYNGTFIYIGDYGDWWSSTEHYTDYAWYRSMYYDYSHVYRYYGYKYDGFSVRCLLNN